MTPPSPKLFISYSWSSPDHEEWVLQLAKELVDNGVDVILDKWHLREGHDAHAFMERMVTDPEIGKVALICDAAYKRKADARSGGVGAEAQIITPDLYAKSEQSKFVAVICERDENGRPLVPAYYGGRIYIDLSDDAQRVDNFERLVRWAYNRPIDERPPLGAPPSYVTEGHGTRLGTSSRARRAVDALRNGRPNAIVMVEEYLNTLSSELERLRISAGEEPFDDFVVRSLTDFLPYRNEAIEIFTIFALHEENPKLLSIVHRFLGSLLLYVDHSENVKQWSEWSFDNFRFIVHELFLYCIATLIRAENFRSAAYLMQTDYFVPGQENYGSGVMLPYTKFRNYASSFDTRNTRLALNRLSLRADLLRERCQGIGVDFRHLMQADFVLYLYAALHRPRDNWWPETLLFANRRLGVCEVFARSQSKRYFDSAQILIDINGKQDLLPFLTGVKAGSVRLPKWQFETFSPYTLLGFDELATRP